MNSDAPGAGDEPIVVAGQIRRLPSPWWLRLVEVLTLVIVLRAALQLFGRLVLAQKRTGTLSLLPGQLQLDEEQSVFGRTVRRSTRVFSFSQLQEIALEAKGEDPRFFAGLASLLIGTLLGASLFVDGLAAGSLPLLLTATVCMLLGLVADYFLGSGRTPPQFAGAVQLLVQPDSRGFVLSGVDLDRAQSFIAETQLRLAKTV